MKLNYNDQRYEAIQIGNSVLVQGMDQITLLALCTEVRASLAEFPFVSLHDFTLWCFEAGYTKDLVEPIYELKL